MEEDGELTRQGLKEIVEGLDGVNTVVLNMSGEQLARVKYLVGRQKVPCCISILINLEPQDIKAIKIINEQLRVRDKGIDPTNISDAYLFGLIWLSIFKGVNNKRIDKKEFSQCLERSQIDGPALHILTTLAQKKDFLGYIKASSDLRDLPATSFQRFADTLKRTFNQHIMLHIVCSGPIDDQSLQEGINGLISAQGDPCVVKLYTNEPSINTSSKNGVIVEGVDYQSFTNANNPRTL